jgi:hypothetical protein
MQYILKQELGTVVLTTTIRGSQYEREFDALTVDFHCATDYLELGNAEENCEFLNGATCYSDGSGLQADAIWEEVEEHGEEKLWEELQEMYEHCTAYFRIS